MRKENDGCLRIALEALPGSDSLLLEQLLPLSEKEAACIEALCELVGPGPLVIDDVADGEGVVVATLPDGRHIVDLAPIGSPDDASWVETNTRLILNARRYLLRLLNDRKRWQQEREKMLAKIESLEATCAHQSNMPTQPR